MMPELDVTSAGLAAHEGKPIDDVGLELLKNNGYPMHEHSARKLDLKLMQDADLVLTMEKIHQQRLMRLYPSHSGRVMLLGKWQGDIEISDPFRKSREAFGLVFRQIERACDSWGKILSEK